MTKLPLRALPGLVLCVLCAFCNRNVGGGLPSSPKHDGEPCDYDVECASDNCSEAGSVISLCQAPANGLVEIDGNCSGGKACVADATCQDGICVAAAPACVALLDLCMVD